MSKMCMMNLLATTILNAALYAHVATIQKVAQQATIRFPDIGLVQIHVVEPLNELPQLVFTDVKFRKVISTIQLGTSDPERFKPHPEDRYTKPFLRFKVISVRELPSPLILAVAVGPGGSDATPRPPRR